MKLLLPMPVVANAPPAPRRTEGKRKSEDAPSFSETLEKAHNSKKKEPAEAEMAAASQQAAQAQQPENKPVQEKGQGGEAQASETAVEGVTAEAVDQSGKGQGKVNTVFPAVEKAETVVVENPSPQATVEADAAPVLPQAAPVETAAADQVKTATPEVKVDPETVLPVEQAPAQPAEVQVETAEGPTAPVTTGMPAELQGKVVASTADPATQIAAAGDAEDALSHTVVNELGPQTDTPQVQTEGNAQAAQALNGVKVANVERSAAELARTAEARNPQTISQISQGIETMVKSGNNSLHLQLYPENLGKIDLRLVMRENGMHVVLNADASLTGSMLERHLPELRQALVDAGVNLSGLTVGNGGAQNQTQTFEKWQNETKKGGYRTRGVARLEAEPVEVEPAVRSRINTKVDYRV